MTVAQVKLWGKEIGAVSWDERQGIALYEFNPEFIKSGIEVSPLKMPLSSTIYSFPSLNKETFHGLPGMLADSLPDSFGNTIINTWLASQGRSPQSFNPVERLCYTGKRGMGALEFFPSQDSSKSNPIDVEKLNKLASQILDERKFFGKQLSSQQKEEDLQDILQVGTSAGGARAKAIIAWNQKTDEIRSGQAKQEEDFSYWILKFDNTKEMFGYGLIEYAYYLMAKSAKINMSESRILKISNRNHFMTKRFDRTKSGKKIHMQSLGGLAHFDFKKPGAYSYEQAFNVSRKLEISVTGIEEQFRRMVFNVIARNQDDHVKNIAFLMNKAGTWSLSPAYDITFSYNSNGDWTNQHQMSINGKRDNFTLDDFKACANNISMKRGKAKEIIAEVQSAVSRWRDFAEEAGVPNEATEFIAKTHRTYV